MKRRELMLASSAAILAACGETGKGASSASAADEAAAKKEQAKQPHELLREQVQQLVDKRKLANAAAAPDGQITAQQAAVEAQVLAAMLFSTDKQSHDDLKNKVQSALFAKIPPNVFQAMSDEVNQPNSLFDFGVEVCRSTLRILSNGVNVRVGNAQAGGGDIYPDPGNPQSCASKATLAKIQGILP